MANASREDDEPLDPAMVRVQARLRRLILISGLTLGVGIVAVFGAILYRILTVDTMGTPAATAPSEAIATEVAAEAVGLPPGAELVSLAIAGTRLALGFRVGADTVVVLVDARTMAVTGRLTVRGE